MPAFHLLENAIQPYAWGSPTAIPDLLGVANPDGGPMAELWIGAHPAAPSRLAADRRPLPEIVAADPAGVLGARIAGVHGERLPFLFKVLAAATPLSIQCHPDSEQARAGFARDEAAGIPRDAAERRYRDAHHKPELIVALTPFVALKGFRAPGDVADDLDEVGAFARQAGELRRTGDLRAFFTAMMRAPTGERQAALAALRDQLGDDRAAHRWVRRLLDLYPGDIGAFAPLLLNLVELTPGEALFLPARELHAYLEGTGLEVMASSDNVLRGGLTSKHVDVDELLRVLRFAPDAPRVLRPAAAPSGWLTYDTPAAEFALAFTDVGATGATREGRDAVDVLLCTGGAVRLEGDGEALHVDRGQSALIPASTGDYRITGRGRVYVVTCPR